jgi:hypothetical protein
VNAERNPKAATKRVDKVSNQFVPTEKDKAEIHIDSAEPLYQEIRIDNELKSADGQTVELKPGADVEVHIEADKAATSKKKE